MNATRICSIDGCGRKFYARGWCRNHYNVMVKELGPKALGLPSCSVENCGKTHYGRGYCRKHWERWKHNGDPLKVLVDLDVGALERFASRVDTSGTCHIWTGYRDRYGYGQLHFNGKPVGAHRFAYQVAHGEIPAGLVVRHRCDNPPCVRADHLEIGTHADNIRDRETRGKGNRGINNPAAVLNESSVVAIHQLVLSGRTYKSVANEFGVGQSTVARIAKRMSWREVLDKMCPVNGSESAT